MNSEKGYFALQTVGGVYWKTWLSVAVAVDYPVSIPAENPQILKILISMFKFLFKKLQHRKDN